MQQFKTILVPLALSENDAGVIRYVSELTKTVDCQKIYFLYVAKTLEIPESIRREHPDMLPPLDESYAHDLKKEVEENFKDKSGKIDIDYNVLEGNRIAQILHHAVIKDVDLIVVGSGGSLEKTSLLATRLAHKAPCSVLSVPYKSREAIKTICCPIDFSEYSNQAFELAWSLANHIKAQLHCVHVFEVPIGYAKAGRTYEEFSEIIEAHAQRKFKELLEEYQCDESLVSCEFLHSHHPAESIRELLTRDTADLLVIGSRGRGAAKSFVLGSVTEELFLTTQVPILSVKEKGENKGFLKALLNFAS